MGIIKVRLAVNLLLFCCMAILMSLANLNIGTTADITAEDLIRPDAIGGPAWLIEQHDCWTGVAPEGAVAGSVVVTLDGEDAKHTRSPRVLQDALEFAILGQDDSNVRTVHAFCP